MRSPVIKRLVGASCGSMAVRAAANTMFYEAFASYTPGGALASIGNEFQGACFHAESLRVMEAACCRPLADHDKEPLYSSSSLAG